MMNLLMSNSLSTNQVSLHSYSHSHSHSHSHSYSRIKPGKQISQIKCFSSLVQQPNMSLSSESKKREKQPGCFRRTFKVFSKSTPVKEMEESAGTTTKKDAVVVKVKGTVVVRRKTLLGVKGVSESSILDTLDGRKISIQLVSAVNSDPGNNLKGKVGKPAHLEKQVVKSTGLADGESAFTVNFDWDEEIDVPGAILVRNDHNNSEFYLKTVTLEDVSGHGKIQFDCNSWVYPVKRYQQQHRVFFTNQTYLLHETPAPLLKYREEELDILRGKGKENVKLEEWDRVYDYAFYNDLGEPDKGPDHVRPIYGGSSKYPYPRRTRTSRAPTKTDPHTESRLPLLEALPHMYVPRDEKFGQLKFIDFLSDTVRVVSHGAVGAIRGVFDKTPTEFDSLQDVLNVYEHGIKLHNSSIVKKLKGLLPIDGKTLKFPMPDIIKDSTTAWRTDEEFAREMLAGLNPLMIRRLENFPPVSKLDPKAYGKQNSSITKECIEKNLDGLNVDEAIKSERLFILEHHDNVMPYLRQINKETTSKVYATRTILFLKEDGTLKPVAIELSRPLKEGDELGAISEVHTPASDGVKGSQWDLAKTYVAITDAGYHQLISHWLNTHAVMEPFVIATYRQLSVLHPVYKLLQPHCRYTISINAVARQIALNANGLFEAAVYPRKFVVEWTSELYKDWVFTEQALPRDLVKRGMAVKDSNSPHGYKLLIEDYPYAVDGLEIWSAIETWVKEYCLNYYKTDEMVASDTELELWWKEIREQGHGDKKDEKWWPQMKTLDELIESCTTIIWVASALHAVVNFGQYPYGGYMPNRPTISRRFMPEPNTPEYEELKTNPDLAFLKTVPDQLQTLLALSVIELISGHSPDEVYLGQRDAQDWTTDTAALEAFSRFAKELSETEERILERNNDPKCKNRVGLAKMPFTLLCPTSGEGITGRGIPNSISI